MPLVQNSVHRYFPQARAIEIQGGAGIQCILSLPNYVDNRSLLTPLSLESEPQTVGYEMKPGASPRAVNEKGVTGARFQT